MKFLIIFIILSIINVIFSTVRSIATIKSGKIVASLLSGGYFAFYNIMLIYTVAEFPMWEKCLITFVCNVMGVYIVKFFEEKMAKDKLWKVEASIPCGENSNKVYDLLKSVDISFNRLLCIGEKYDIYNIFCSTKAESEAVKEILKKFDVKYFVSESKNL